MIPFIDDDEMTRVRDAVTKALGLPRDGAACLFVIVSTAPDGTERQRMGTIGLSEYGAALVLASAMHAVARDPDVRMDTSKPGN